MMPLFVQQHVLLTTMGNGLKGPQTARGRMLATASIAAADVAAAKMQSQQEWSLLPAMGFLSSVYPMSYVSGAVGWPGVRFPSWFGRNSTRRAQYSALRDMAGHISGSAALPNSSSVRNMRLDYGEALVRHIWKHSNGMEDMVERVNAYALTRDDVDSLAAGMSLKDNEKTSRVTITDYTKLATAAQKAKLTRELKKGQVLPYATMGVKKSKARVDSDSAGSGPAGARPDDVNDDAKLLQQQLDEAREEEQKRKQEAFLESMKAKTTKARAKARGGARAKK